VILPSGSEDLLTIAKASVGQTSFSETVLHESANITIPVSRDLGIGPIVKSDSTIALVTPASLGSRAHDELGDEIGNQHCAMMCWDKGLNRCG